MPIGDLDLLGRPLADHQVVLLADVGHDRVVEPVAPDAQAIVDTTIPSSEMTAISLVPPPMSMIMLPGRAADRDVGTDRRGQRLLDQVGVLRAPAWRAASRTARFSTLVTPAGTQIMTSGLLNPRTPADLADEVAQHRLGDHVVGDDAVLHRPDDTDVAGRPPDHLAGLLADRHDRLSSESATTLTAR